VLFAAALVSVSAGSAMAAPALPPLLVIRQTVADYAKWRPIYLATAMKAAGVVGEPEFFFLGPER
jgi:hypothetical protein